nr:GNAT family N-acetyltransferase [Bacillus mediterraneensis]
MNAARVLVIQRAAYRLEAELIGTDEIPPLKESLEDLQGCGQTFIGYYNQGELAGVLSYKKEEGTIDIHRLVVAPAHFRKGIARKLLGWLENQETDAELFTVSTGRDNEPAVCLYKSLGYVLERESIVGPGIKLVHFTKLKRA